MKKKIGLIKLRIISGKANPAPPIGPALGQKGLNIMEFCKKFNFLTKDIENVLLSVKVIFFSDKTYIFYYKKPNISFLIKNLLKIDKFSPNEKKIINYKDILFLAKYKISDFNTTNFYSSVKIILGNIKSLGLSIC